MNTLILDVDGVLLDYEKAFNRFFGLGMEFWEMKRNESEVAIPMYHYFNDSDAFGLIGPVTGAREGVQLARRLFDNVVAVTACGDSEVTRERRVANLNRVFGEWAFDEIHVLPVASSKYEVFEEYQGGPVMLVDDSARHIKTGMENDWHCVYFDTKYNSDPHPDFIAANGWGLVQLQFKEFLNA